MGSYHHGALRDALLEAAERSITEQGPEGFTMRQLAREIGVSHTAAYRHFADREALLAAVAEVGFRRLSASFEQATCDLAHPSEALTTTGITYVRFAVSNPALFQLMFRMRGSAGAHPGLEAASDEAFGVLVAGIEAGQASGQIRPGLVEPLALTAWSLMHGLACLIVDGAITAEQVPEPEAVASQLIELLRLGFEPRPFVGR